MKNFKKEDLKVNDIVVIKCGSDDYETPYLIHKLDGEVFGVGIDCDDILSGKHGWGDLNSDSYSAIAVYRPSSTHHLIPRYIVKFKNNFKLVWEFEKEIEELTMEQVCKELGRDVKIKK